MDPETARAFVDALGALSGIVAMTGAGGKKSAMFRLLEAHRALGTSRVLLTSTVQIAAGPARRDLEVVVTGMDDVEAAIAETKDQDGAFLVAGPSEKPGRFSGLPDSLIPRLHKEGAFGVSLVKADGARMRMIKGPREDEPALPVGVTTILPIVSARVFGRPLDEKLAHRPMCLAAIIGAGIDTELTPDHVAKLLTSPEGALRRAGDAKVVPVINMVDDPERLKLSREAARKALSMTERFERVVLTAMTSPSPLIEVVTG